MNVLLLCACLLLQGEAGAGADAQKELARFQGIWNAVDLKSAGKALPRQWPLHFTLVVVGESYALNSRAGVLKLNAARRELDLQVDEERGRGQTVKGVYEFTEKGLRVAFGPIGGARPRKIEGEPGQNHLLLVLERDQEATPEDAAKLLASKRE